MELILRKGGKLEKKEWNPKKQDYTYLNVTKKVVKVLTWPVSLDPDVTLIDLLRLGRLLPEPVLEVFTPWFKEFLEEGLSPTKEKDTAMEFLEFYRIYCIEEGQTIFNSFPSFHGLSFVDSQGDRTPYGVWCSPINTYAHLPLKLKMDVEIYDGPAPAKFVIPSVGYTLMDLFQGFFWEISFSGPPVKRDKFAKDVLCAKETL